MPILTYYWTKRWLGLEKLTHLMKWLPANWMASGYQSRLERETEGIADDRTCAVFTVLFPIGLIENDFSLKSD